MTLTKFGDQIKIETNKEDFMNAKKLTILVLKVIALTIILFLCFALTFNLASAQADVGQAASQQSSTTSIPLLLVCFLYTIVLTYLILRSRWAGWRLITTVFFVFYGVMTVMGQIESLIFLTGMSRGMLARLFLNGALIAAIFTPLAVLVLGKIKQDINDDEPNFRLVMPKLQWAWKLLAVAVIYLGLYFTFGYFIAWKSPALREFYGGTDPGNFFVHLSMLFRFRPWLAPFQVLRAMMWTALALPVIRMLKGQWWEAGLAVGLVFAIVLNAQLLIPNPYMPEAVRMTHLVETASSNFIFGWLMVWLLNRHHKSLRGLFQWSKAKG
jgi:hypothetical protein